MGPPGLSGLPSRFHLSLPTDLSLSLSLSVCVCVCLFLLLDFSLFHSLDLPLCSLSLCEFEK